MYIDCHLPKHPENNILYNKKQILFIVFCFRRTLLCTCLSGSTSEIKGRKGEREHGGKEKKKREKKTKSFKS